MELKKTTKALIIFIKNPVKGKVKTRLARDADDEYALKVYIELQRITRDITSRIEVVKYLYYSSHIQHDDMWDDKTFHKKVQQEGDLGHKMKSAFNEIFKNHSKVIIIGSDCIQLDTIILNKAYDALEDCDVVLGPAIDGGYYLLGLKDAFDDIFEGIQWSTSEVLNQTIHKALGKGKSCHLLPALSDIDYLEDWEKYGYELD